MSYSLILQHNYAKPVCVYACETWHACHERIAGRATSVVRRRAHLLRLAEQIDMPVGNPAKSSEQASQAVIQYLYKTHYFTYVRLDDLEHGACIVICSQHFKPCHCFGPHDFCKAFNIECHQD